VAGIETYKRSIGAKALKRLMVGKPVDPADLQAAVADQHFGLIMVKILTAEKPKDIDEWDALIKRLLSYEEDGQKKYEALMTIDANLDIHTQAKDRWGQPFTLADAYEDRPPVEYIVKGIFEVGSLSILYGAPGSMKSLLAAQMLVDIVGGTNWLERMNNQGGGFPTITKGCLWLDFDNGKNRTHARFKALGLGRKLPVEAPLRYYSMAWPVLDASDAVQIGELIERIKTYDVSFVVIDNLGVISGGRDENTSQMQEVIAGLRKLADETNTAIVVIHHSRKTSGFSGGRSGDAMRGHSSIEAGLDLALLVTREEQSDMVEIKATKVRGATVKPFSAQFTYEHRAGTDELETARFFGVDVVDMTSDAAIKSAILDVIGAGNITDSKPLNQGEVVTQVMNALPDVGDQRIRKMIKVLLADKLIKFDKGLKNAKLLTLVNDEEGESGDDDD
jgi:hypothetical protein